MAAGKLSFTQTEFRIREDGSYIGAKVSVERIEGNTGLVSVKVTNSSASSLGRGTRKLDFLPINPTTSTGSSQLLTWNDGEGGIKTLEFTIIQENLVEGDEFIPLSLGSYKGGAVAGEITKCNLIIVDDDSAKGIQGEKGEKGDKGDTRIGIQGINVVGVWNRERAYQKDEAVWFGGNLYICVQEGVKVGQLPWSEGWDLIAYGAQWTGASNTSYGTIQNSLFACRTSINLGGITTFPHGLNKATIKGITAVLRTNLLVAPGGLTVPGYYYDVSVTDTHIRIALSSDSNLALDKEVFVTLTH